MSSIKLIERQESGRGKVCVCIHSSGFLRIIFLHRYVPGSSEHLVIHSKDMA